jgi:hypothetical protein
MINAFHFDNPVSAHDAMCERMIWGDNTDPRNPDYDWSHGTEVGLHNVSIHCDTIAYDYNLKKLWVPPSRWSMMVRQYIDPVALEDCEIKIADRMAPPRRAGETRGISVLRTRLVQGKGAGRGVRRRWGSCMLNLSFRRNPVPTVTLNSRTTYFGYLAMVDVSVARTFAQRCADIVGIPLESVEFVWHLDLAQFHGFRSLAWMLGDDPIRASMDEALPDRLSFPTRRAPGNQVGWRKALDGYARIKKSDDNHVLYGDESFSSFARVRRRFHTEVFGPEYAAQFEGGTRNRGGKKSFDVLPDLWTSDLTFAALIGRGGDNEMFDDDEDEDEE